MEGIIKKILGFLVLAVMVLAVIFFVSPKFKQNTLNLSAKTVKGVSFTANKIKSFSTAIYQKAKDVASKAAPLVQRSAAPKPTPKPTSESWLQRIFKPRATSKPSSSKTKVTASSCGKEFADLPINDPNYGWAYWAMHSAKQDSLFYNDTDNACADPYNIKPADKVSEWNVRCFGGKIKNGPNFDCSLQDGRKDYYYSFAEVQSYITDHFGWKNPPGWSTYSGGLCGNTPGVSYPQNCVDKAHLVTAGIYNANKPINILISGELSVARNLQPPSTLVGAKVDLYFLNDDGTRQGSPYVSTQAFTAGSHTTYTIGLNLPIQDAYQKFLDKNVEVLVTKDGFYPDSAYVKIDGLKKQNDHLMVWKEDPNQSDFLDIPSDHWAYWYIQSLVQNKVMFGYPDKNFRPDQNVSRAETAVYSTLAINKKLCCAPGIGQYGECSTCTGTQYFADLPLSDYYWGYAQSALLAPATMTGYEDRTFRPDLDLVASQAKLTITKPGYAYSQPFGYTGNIDSSTELVSRARMAALYAWNFNLPVTVNITGKLTVQDNAQPVENLIGANAEIIDNQTGTIAKTMLSQIGTDGSYNLSFTWKMQDFNTKVLGKNVFLEIDAGPGFYSADTPTFVIKSSQIKFDLNIEPKPHVTFHGVIKYKGVTDHSCDTDLKNLAMQVTIESRGSDHPASVVAKYDPKTNTLPYSLDVESDRPQDENGNPLIENFNLDATGNDIYPYETNPAVDPGKSDVQYDIEVSPKQITFRGRVTDKTTKQPLSNVDVEANILLSNKTDVAGYYKISYPMNIHEDLPGELYLSLSEHVPTGYQIIVDGIVKYNNFCPSQSSDFELDKNPVCEKFNNVTICFYGAEAQAWHSNPGFHQLWVDLADKMNFLNIETKLQTNGINIVSGSLNGWAVVPDNPRIPEKTPLYRFFGGWVHLGTDLMKFPGDPASVSAFDQHGMTHEFGHIFLGTLAYNGGLWTLANTDKWKSIFKTGDSISPWNNSQWSKITDSTYTGFGGHPSSNFEETFASSFMIMDSYRPDFLNVINNEPVPEVKAWLKTIYNTHVNEWDKNNGVDLLALLRKIIAKNK